MLLSPKNISFLRYFVILIILTIPYAIRDFTPGNELKYISIATEALQNGRFFAFTDHGATYADKPPLYIWGLMIIIKFFGCNYPILFGLLSTIPACIILAVMDKWTAQFLPSNYSAIPSLLLVTTGIFLGAALVLRMDVMMCMFIVLSLYVFYNVYTGNFSSNKKYLFTIFLFLAVFTKGPLGFLIPVVSIVAFFVSKREIYRLKEYGYQLLIFFLFVLVWFICIYIEGGGDYIKDIVFRQLVERGVESFDHNEPFYYYFITMWYCLLPWILSYLIILFLAVKKRLFKNDIQRFFTTVIITTFLLISLVSCKLDIYLLPLVPFLVYLVIMFLPNINTNKYVKYSFGFIYALFFLSFPFYFLFGTYFLPIELSDNYLVIIGLLIMAIFSLLAVYKLKRDLSLSIKFICTGISFLFLVWTFAFKEFNSYIGFRELDKELQILSLNNQVKNYYSYKIWDISYIDIYSGNRVVNLHSIEDMKEIPNGNDILIVTENRLKKEPELIDTFSTKERFRVGNYNIFVVN